MRYNLKNILLINLISSFCNNIQANPEIENKSIYEKMTVLIKDEKDNYVSTGLLAMYMQERFLVVTKSHLLNYEKKNDEQNTYLSDLKIELRFKSIKEQVTEHFKIENDTPYYFDNTKNLGIIRIHLPLFMAEISQYETTQKPLQIDHHALQIKATQKEQYTASCLTVHTLLESESTNSSAQAGPANIISYPNGVSTANAIPITSTGSASDILSLMLNPEHAKHRNLFDQEKYDFITFNTSENIILTANTSGLIVQKPIHDEPIGFATLISENDQIMFGYNINSIRTTIENATFKTHPSCKSKEQINQKGTQFVQDLQITNHVLQNTKQVIADLVKTRNHNLKLEQENNELKQKLKQYEKNANDLD